jgi:hypothetical protein
MTEAESPASSYTPPKALIYLAVFVVFTVGLIIRFYDLTDLPLDFQSTRQMHSVIIARGMYYQDLSSAPEWQREVAVRNWKAEGLIEPQFMEWLTATTYRLTGSEQLWYARVYSILFWTAGAAALFMLAQTLTGTAGALIAVIYFLILPYGAIASRSFQPDPLMTALIVFALWAAVRWERNPSWKWAAVAGLLGAAAILSKAVALFFVGGAWVGLVLGGMGLRRALRNRQVWAIAAITIVPYAIYHIYGVYISGLLESQLSLRFFPQLWSDPVFYLRWKSMISSTAGFEWFVAAFIASFVLVKPQHRGLLAGLWVGYFAYGMIFAYHISTHDYYNLPLIPIVALGLASGADLLFRNLRGRRAVLYPVIVALLVFVVAVQAWDVRVTLKRDDFRNEPIFWQKLGQKLGQNKSVVGLTQDYGFRLEYWGWVSSEFWYSSGDFNLQNIVGGETDPVKLFKERTDGKDYFVVTLLPELDRQPKLKSLLYNNYSIVDENSDYVIFDLRHPLQQTP